MTYISLSLANNYLIGGDSTT